MEEGFESILNHVFGSSALQLFGYFGPLLAERNHSLDQLEIFLNFPVSSQRSRIKMVYPMFSALFGSPEIFLFGQNE